MHLRHEASTFKVVNGIVLRDWKQKHETEAYWVGAAALVPRRVMKGAITRRMTIIDLAGECGVSRQLVEFRERILGLKLLRPAA